MEPSSGQSSPTLHSPRFSMSLLLPTDINSVNISAAMDEDQLRAVSALSIMDPKIEDASFFDLCPPPPRPKMGNAEEIMKQLFSEEHLLHILGDYSLFHRFSIFVNTFKPQSAPTLVRYQELQKAMKSIEYANAVATEIRWSTHSDHHKFNRVAAATPDVRLGEYAARELQSLRLEVMPAWISHHLTNFVVDCVTRDITGHAIPAVADLVGNLAEVFCLTDPSLPDNPIIYASEEFHKTTQYGTSYAIDRNCRFLQGPATDENCVHRISEALSKGEQVCETILNYRRDGSPFINLLMCAPLYDDKGYVRYHIGAQVDVTGLVLEGRAIESFRSHLRSELESPSTPTPRAYTPDFRPPHLHSPTTGLEQHPRRGTGQPTESPRSHDSLNRLKELSRFLSLDEVEVVARNSRGSGGLRNGEPASMPTPPASSDDVSTLEGRGPGSKARGQGKRVIDPNAEMRTADLRRADSPQPHLSMTTPSTSYVLPGVYKHYILTQPYPSLRILFVSPSLRIPGLLRTPLFSRLGGSASTLNSLSEAFRDGASVTAKVSWLPKISANPVADSDQGRPRWIRCSPLLGSDDKVGVWMIILVPEEGDHIHEIAHKETRSTDYFSEFVKADRLQETQRAAPRANAATTSSKSSMHTREPLNGNGHPLPEHSQPQGRVSSMGFRKLGKMKLGSHRAEKERDNEKDLYADYMRSLAV